MRRFGWIIAMFLGSQGWAMSKGVVPSNDLAFLSVSGGEDAFAQVTRLKPTEPLKDPLLCKLVENKLNHLQRIERQLVALREKIAAGRAPDSDYREIDILEERRQQTYDFLAEPAPEMEAQWSLENLWDPLLENLKAEAGAYQLKSYALLWEGLGESFSTPKEAAVIIVDDWNRTLTLVLRASVASYCSREATRLDFQL